MTINERYQALKNKHTVIKDIASDIERDIEALQTECPHDNIIDKWGTGVCPDCGYKTDGWFCPDSPDYECQYYDEKTDTYDEDCCIYCGQPDERK